MVVFIDPVGCNRDDQGSDGDRARYLNTDPHDGLGKPAVMVI